MKKENLKFKPNAVKKIDTNIVLKTGIKKCKCCGFKNATNFTYCYECGNYI